MDPITWNKCNLAVDPTKTLMKNKLLFSLVIFFLLFFQGSAYCQWGNWSNPMPITESASDHMNATLCFLRFQETDYYMFWERSTDSNSTSIIYKKFYNSDEVEILRSEEGIHFKSPQLMDLYYNSQVDTTFIILYEANTSGYNDIFYQFYTFNGFTEAAQLSNTTFSKSELQVSDDGDIVWMENNKVMFVYYDRNNDAFSDPIVLDSGDCFSPTVRQLDGYWGFSHSTTAWVKHENDSAHIMLKQQNYNGEWEETNTIFSGADCVNLSFAGGFGFDDILSWDHYNDTVWRIEIYNPKEDDFVQMQYTQDEPFNPFVFSGDMPVKKSYWEGIAYLGFTAENQEQTDILASPLFYTSPFIEDYDTVSDSYNTVRNTKIYMGKSGPGCEQYFNNIWEEEVNGNWQIMYAESHTCLSEVDENVFSNLNLEIFPNPSKELSQITFFLDKSSNVKLTILDSKGMVIQKLVEEKLSGGKHVYNWRGSDLTNGLYFVSLQSDQIQISKKIILLK